MNRQLSKEEVQEWIHHEMTDGLLRCWETLQQQHDGLEKKSQRTQRLEGRTDAVGGNLGAGKERPQCQINRIKTQ